jgi:formylglycine-generating enzyme required for sulfatase activity
MRTQPALAKSLDDARQRTDALFRLVRPDSLYERPIPERHRIIFYLGHLEAFDWNLIGRYAAGLKAFNPEFDHLFAFGIDPPPGQLPSDQPTDWPSQSEVEGYNRRVRETVDEALDEVPEQILHAAIEHRLMHAETFGYILHQLDYERKTGPIAGEPQTEAGPREPWMIDVPAGSAQLGLEEGAFGWDNEFDAHSVDVPAFSIAKFKVTNGEYLEFVREGGGVPFFWSSRGDAWFQRGMFAEVPLPLDWPVYVTYEQASAYAAWRGAALATEAQFHRAASLAVPTNGQANFDFRNWDPVPVQEGDVAAASPAQLTDNGWEWTSTVFAPFPGFTAFPFYQNYSEPFFDGRHYVLKGASPLTAARLARPSFRNWFRPAYPYVYATFRLVEQ